MASAKTATTAGVAANTLSKGKPPFWRDERVRGIIAQVVAVLLLVATFAFLIYNFLEKQSKASGPAISFDFLTNVAGFQLSFSIINVTLDSQIGHMILAGMINTLLAAAIAAFFATILGLVVGVARLSKNWLISRIAATYIEIIRNIPLLLQLVFWFGAMIAMLPLVKESVTLGDVIFLNKKGLFLPKPIFEGSIIIFLISIGLAIGIAGVISRWANRRQIATGQQFPVISVNTALIVLLPLLTYVIVDPVVWEIPQKGGFNFKGGLTVQPEMTALIIGLAISTSAYIAEIVRAGIIAVSHGQTEAALALGLKQSWTLRLVILPQALRVIIPPLISQYLNVVKNSTLAGFIGYADLFAVIGTSQNQTGRAIECVIILMGFYLAVSLIISSIMNVYNKRAALVER
jgi:general L-amino acid transport system permease protein